MPNMAPAGPKTRPDPLRDPRPPQTAPGSLQSLPTSLSPPRPKVSFQGTLNSTLSFGPLASCQDLCGCKGNWDFPDVVGQERQNFLTLPTVLLKAKKQCSRFLSKIPYVY